MDKRKMITLTLLLGMTSGIFAGCSKSPKYSKKEAESISVAAASESYESYLSDQKEKHPLDMDSLRTKYNDITNEYNTIMYIGNSRNGSYGNVDNNAFNLQAVINNKFKTKDDREGQYDIAMSSIGSAKQSLESKIDDNNDYRDNKILKEMNKFYKEELKLVEMNKTKFNYLMGKSKVDNSADIELYKTQIANQYKKIKKMVDPIIQQANFESQSTAYRQRKAQEQDTTQGKDFGAVQGSQNLYGNTPINGSTSKKSDKELDNYTVQIPKKEDSQNK